jgi:ABC-type sugar transport system ATPase subunit
MIVLDGLCLTQGRLALRGISLTVARGEHAVLMGRTGCGKTTLLEAVCGLRAISAGRVLLDGLDVTALRPGDRGVGYLPQDGALFRAMTVHANVGYALRVRGWGRTAIDQRVRDLARMVGIADLLDRRPATLSGGEAQRVALARALAAWPTVLCLDEPLAALDTETRDAMIGALRAVRRETQVTILHVTHSPAEAEALADRLFLLEAGGVYETLQRPQGV